ncbi:MAG: hypothetical protein JWO05_3002 [Gemmatimonadetes bacterium]|nr:hypothetical protein [Gemmatimonadota bacterium]
MTHVAVASTGRVNADAGSDLAGQIRDALGGYPPHALLVFASAQNDYAALLASLQAGCSPRVMIGCSSAGEFTGESDGTGRTSAIAFRSDEMEFRGALARDLSADRPRAVTEILSGFGGMANAEYRYRTAFVLVDALAGHAEDFVDELTQATGGMYRLAGGGAGDDGRFSTTHVFMGNEAHTNAAVALEILSNKPIGIGARHGWSASGGPLRVTESANACVVSFNVAPAVEAYDEHASATGQAFDHANPLPFFLHNIAGVKTEEGYKLRVPLGIAPEGGVMYAAEIATGATAQIMWTKSEAAAEAAASATRDALDQVTSEGFVPGAAIFLDCVATRLRLGQAFTNELDAVHRELGDVPFAGFNSYGQIVRAEGQFSGFHNCTAVVVVIPD